ncbi:Hypothetical predicted protein [Xyrichtys novacula]|uniref:Uncharacterized protein n=1 Tax=Xyrichtys novacula TaxID=13765 RepID=A0AAV1F3W7_XYRNO|nr:Hypothetical predicted protein [Xyrichtys novacula]
MKGGGGGGGGGGGVRAAGDDPVKVTVVKMLCWRRFDRTVRRVLNFADAFSESLQTLTSSSPCRETNPPQTSLPLPAAVTCFLIRMKKERFLFYKKKKKKKKKKKNLSKTSPGEAAGAFHPGPLRDLKTGPDCELCDQKVDELDRAHTRQDRV